MGGGIVVRQGQILAQLEYIQQCGDHHHGHQHTAGRPGQKLQILLWIVGQQEHDAAGHHGEEHAQLAGTGIGIADDGLAGAEQQNVQYQPAVEAGAIGDLYGQTHAHQRKVVGAVVHVVEDAAVFAQGDLGKEEAGCQKDNGGDPAQLDEQAEQPLRVPVAPADVEDGVGGKEQHGFGQIVEIVDYTREEHQSTYAKPAQAHGPAKTYRLQFVTGTGQDHQTQKAAADHEGIQVAPGDQRHVIQEKVQENTKTCKDKQSVLKFL